MKTTEEYMRELSEDALSKAFDEYEKWRETGILQDGVLRDVYDRIREEWGGSFSGPHFIVEPFLYEVARRFYLRRHCKPEGVDSRG